jgi:sugar lactone lactonase YvrE
MSRVGHVPSRDRRVQVPVDPEREALGEAPVRFDPWPRGHDAGSDLTGRRVEGIDFGQIVKIEPGTGRQTAFGPTIETPGLLTGVAFDAQGRLYVANATFSDEELPGVFRIDAGHATRVLTLPEESFPNGLAVRDSYLYVSDSALGAVWRAPLKTASTPVAPWFQDSSLLPSTGGNDHGIGANGIAFKSGDLYVAVSDAGRIVRVPVLPSGVPGAPRVVSYRPTCRVGTWGPQ